jgi:hypothetical protein
MRKKLLSVITSGDRRKTVFVLAAIALLALTFSFGGTYAFLTISGQAVVNDFYIGETVTAIDEVFPAQNIQLTAGETFTKNMRVTNDGNLPCFVRVRAVFSSAEAEAAMEDLIPNADWTLQDGWYYYNGILEPEQSSAYLLSAAYGGKQMKFRDTAEDIQPFDLTFYMESIGKTDGQTQSDYITVWNGV